MTSQAPAVKLGRPKSEEKRQAIMACASRLFLSNGFTNTSMDLVAKEAGVSKQTVYSHFRNKDDLYTAVIDAKCREYRLDASRLEGCDAPCQEVLFEIANQTISLLQDSDVIAMYKVVIGEANNNPRVAELFYRAGPQQSVKTVASILASFYPSLSEEQAQSFAVDFFNLLKADFHMRSLLQLQFTLSQEQQRLVCLRVCQQIQTLIANAANLPIVSH
ncbi:TetR/AcrR family transcriptional regulator [Alteromonas facilis]|uniref:TetR/AcrR family transcriptional regulator n=1 Tax=Alteromonas facilis TaxID=2048004 RepID=UPI000C28762C|nr:TetR/AcrR family transcriptional regulator [Alteromonas facilis]